MNAPYRTAPERHEGPRRLEPEDEMRLVLARDALPRGRDLWVTWITAIAGIALAVWGLAAQDPSGFLSIMLFLYGGTFHFGRAYYKYRRYVAELRAAGFDVPDGRTRVARDDGAVRTRIHPDASEPVGLRGTLEEAEPEAPPAAERRAHL